MLSGFETLSPACIFQPSSSVYYFNGTQQKYPMYMGLRFESSARAFNKNQIIFEIFGIKKK